MVPSVPGSWLTSVDLITQVLLLLLPGRVCPGDALTGDQWAAEERGQGTYHPPFLSAELWSQQ